MIVTVEPAFCTMCGCAVEYERVSDPGVIGGKVFSCRNQRCVNIGIKYTLPVLHAQRYYPLPRLLTKNKVA